MPYENLDDYAEFYDLIYQDEGDMEFYVSEALKVDGKVLEIGCGTGRIYLELLDAGVDAYGIDISESMLDKLEEKAEDWDLDTKVSRANMQDFDLDEKFSLIIIPFRSFLHNLTIEDQLSTLEAIYEHLESDGKLILNFYSPELEVISETYGEEHRREIEGNDGEKLVEVRHNELVDEVNWIVEFSTKILKDGEKLWESAARNKIVTRPEFELLLRQSDFSSWEVFGGFEKEELENSSQEMVWFVEK